MPESKEVENTETKLVSDEGAPDLTPLPALSAAPTQVSSSHSIFHGMLPARCDSKWEAMPGSDTVRTCGICKAKVYSVQGLDEIQLAEVIASNESTPRNPSEHFFRRKDGTVMVQRGRCATLSTWLSVAMLSAFAVHMVWTQLFGAGIGRIGVFKSQDLCLIVGVLLIVISLTLQDKKNGTRSWGTKGAFFLLAGTIGCSSLTFFTTLPPLISVLPMVALAICFPAALLCFFVAGVQSIWRIVRPKQATSHSADAQSEEAAIASPKPSRKIRNAVLSIVLVVIAAAVWDFSWVPSMLSTQAPALTMSSVSFKNSEIPPPKIDDMEKLLQRSSGDRADFVRCLLARLYLDADKPEKAKALLALNIEHLAGKNVNNQVLIWSRKALAACLVKDKNYSAAEAEYNRALGELQSSQASQGGMRIVFGSYQSLSWNQPFQYENRREILSLLGLLKSLQGDTAASDSNFLQANKPFDGEKFSYLSMLRYGVEPYISILQKKGRTADATKVVEQYENDCRRLVEPYLQGLAADCVARAYAQLNDPRAGRALERQVKMEDASRDGLFKVSARLKYAKFLAKTGDLKKAEVYFREAVRDAHNEQKELDQTARTLGPMQNTHLQRASEEFADFLVQQKRFKESEENFRVALKDAAIDDGPARTQFNDSWRYSTKLADSLVSQNRIPEAVDLMRKTDTSLKTQDLSDSELFYFMKHFQGVMKAGGAPEQEKYKQKMLEMKQKDAKVDGPLHDYYTI